MLDIFMGIRKKEMTTTTHGKARVQVSEPLRACVGPQERPKGEYAPEFGAHRDMIHTEKIGRPGAAHSVAMGWCELVTEISSHR